MTIWQAVLLGLVQGLTEFLPVSSSGHLVLTQHILGLDLESVTFEVAVHLGTLVAVLVYFRRDLTTVIVDFFRGGPGRKVGLLILLALVPTGIIGVGFKDFFEMLFAAPRWAAAALLVTSALLVAAEKVRQGDRPLMKGMKWTDALLIGTIQGFAIIPGISRSGSTIAAGLFAGLSRDAAARFSFLLAIPAILGAAVLHMKDFTTIPSGMIVPFIVGFIASALSGYVAIYWLLKVLTKGRLYGFAIYTALVGILGLILI